MRGRAGRGSASWALVTSDGQRLCIATYKNDADEPAARGCAAVAPNAIAQLGDKLWLVDAIVDRPPEPPPDASPAPKPKPKASRKTGKGKGKSKAKSAPRKPAPKLGVDVR